MTRQELELLADVRIASPCPVAWREMKGDEKRRLCGQCNLHVHNLSALTSAEVVALFRGPGERVCAQVFRRLDGTLMTKDCPSTWSVAVSRAISRVGPVAGALTTAVAVLVALVVATAFVFGDNVRALFGQAAGDLSGGDPHVERRGTPMTPTLTTTVAQPLPPPDDAP